MDSHTIKFPFINNCLECDSICKDCSNLKITDFKMAIRTRDKYLLEKWFNHSSRFLLDPTILECQYVEDGKIKLTPLEWYGKHHDLEMITYILNQSLLKFGEYNLLITPTYIDSILDELNIIQFMFYLNYTFSHNDITKIINWNTNKSEIQIGIEIMVDPIFVVL